MSMVLKVLQALPPTPSPGASTIRFGWGTTGARTRNDGANCVWCQPWPRNIRTTGLDLMDLVQEGADRPRACVDSSIPPLG